MTRIRAFIVGFFLSLSAISVGSTANAQGIPVYDNSNTLQSIAQVANQIEQLVNDARDFENQVRQLTNLEDQLAAITGARNFGALGNGLPQYEDRRFTPGIIGEYYELGDGAGSGEAADIVEDLRDEFEPMTGDELVPSAPGSPFAKANDRRRQATYAAAAVSTVSFNNYIERVENIERMLVELDSVTDLKSSTDLQTRILAETALVQAEGNQLRSSQIQLQTAEEIQDQTDAVRAIQLGTYDGSALAGVIE